MCETLPSPAKIGGMTIKTRAGKAAKFSPGQPDGKPAGRMMKYCGKRAGGGACCEFGEYDT